METRWASDVAQLPRNDGYFPEKRFGESEKIVTPNAFIGWRSEQSLFQNDCSRPLAPHDQFLRALTAVGPRLLLAPTGSYTQKMLAIGR
jgi:hypothetical protein